MPDNNPLQQAFFAQQAGLSPQSYQQLMAAQQQQALSQALLQEGETPISQQGREIGGMATRISPLEGVAKLAQILAGKEGQQESNSALASALTGGNQGGQMAQSNDPIIGSMPPQTQALFKQWSLPESYGGNPRAAAQLYDQFASGMKAYQTGAGTAAAQNAPVGTLPPGVGQAPPQPPMPPQPSPQSPVSPPQGALPTTTTMAPQGPALQQYRQQNGMLPPPIDNQRASMGLPIGASTPPNPQGLPSGTNVPTQAIPPVSAQALNAGMPAGMPPVAPPQALPAALPGESNLQYQERLKSTAAGQTAQASKVGEDLGDAQKTFNVAAANLPRAMQRFDQLRQAAKQASSGGGVSDQEPAQGFFEHFLPGPDYARSFARTSVGQTVEPQTAIANQTIDQATKQGVLSELGPQMAGLKGNKFLESLASGASGLNPADPPPAKINAINGLQDQYISNLKSLAQQRRTYGDPSAPSDMDLAKLIVQNATPNTTVSAVNPQGILGRVNPQDLLDLIQAGGQLR